MKPKRNAPCPCGSGKKYKKCCAVKQNDQAESLLNIGIAHVKQGNTKDAVIFFQKALTVNPKYIEAYINLGLLYDRIGLLEEALSSFSRAVSINSNNPVAQFNLGVISYKKQRYEEAVACFEKALSIDPQYPDANFSLGIVYKNMNCYDEAIACFEKQLSLNPEYLIANVHLATIYEKKNDLDKAKYYLEKVQDHDMLKADYLLLRARLHFREDELHQAVEQLDLIKERAKTPQIYSLYGKIYDRMEKEDKAFTYFIKANNAASEGIYAKKIDPVGYLNKIEQLKNKYTREWVAQWTNVSGLNDDTPTPVFLVGFPRSGTTLLDQVLSTHDDIEVLEEWPMLEVMARKSSALDESLSDYLVGLGDDDINNLRREYYELAGPYLPEDITGKTIIDKFPLNIIKVGLIHRIFPKARILLAIRHPFDICLSNFMQDYKLNDAMANFITLEGTARMYSEVMDLWLQYTEVLDLDFHIIKYENMVEDLESESRKIFDFLSVPWDEKVLEFYQHVGRRKSIKTPSYQDISKPIFTRARYRWKRYEKYFDPVKELLLPHVEHFGYTID